MILDYLDGPNVITRVHIRGKQLGLRWCDDRSIGQRGRDGRLYSAGFVDERWCHEPKNAGSL